MNADKKKRLEKAGWKVGSVEELLNLSPAESAFIEFKMAMARYLKEKRKEEGLTQIELAHRIHTSQSRVAKMENIDPTVTVDLLLRALLALGASKKDLARKIAA